MSEEKFVGGDEEALAILKLLDPSVTSLDPDDSVVVGVATGEKANETLNTNPVLDNRSRRYDSLE